jgi:hypothetical protein
MKAFLYIFALFAFNALGQPLATTLDPEASTNLAQVSYPEKIVLTSKSKRIFIVTHQSNAMEPGDLVTAYYRGNKVFRALVAKSRDSKIGLKILKSFDQTMKNSLQPGQEVRLVKGDDSVVTVNQTNEPRLQIKNESDLYSEDLLVDIEGPSKPKKKLPEQNIIQLGIGVYQGIDEFSESKFYTHWVVNWAFRLKQAWWLEAGYGYSPAKRFPAKDIGTDLHSLTFKAKYSYELPFFSFAAPYAGLQVVIPQSSEAGVIADSTTELTDEQVAENQASADRELDLVDESQKITPVIGITLLKRFVPGWFVTANLGTDSINVGLSIGF